MYCPDCQTQLSPHEFFGVQVDQCPHCHGQWFARDELKKAKDSADADLSWINFDPFNHELDPQEKTPEGVLCPACQTEMHSIEYDHSNVFIDICQNCRGVWLYHDEFEKILDYLSQLAANESSVDLAYESIHQLVDVVGHKKAVESGLQDFCVILKLMGTRIGLEHPQLAHTVDSIRKYLPFL